MDEHHGEKQRIGTIATGSGHNNTYTVTGNTIFNSYNTKYWWSVNVTDNTTWTNATYTFTSRGAFEPAAPSNFVSSAYNCTSIALNWTRGANADKTVIVMSTTGYPTSPSDGTEVYNDTDNNTWVFIDNLASNTTYYFSAWGWNNTDSVFSSGYATTTDTTYKPPNQPYNLIPANGTTGVSLTPELLWNCTDPYNTSNLTYDVYLDTSNPPTQKVRTNTTDLHYYTGGLSANTVYYWKVVAWNDYDGKNTSDIYHFTTAAGNLPPYAPTRDGTNTSNQQAYPDILYPSYAHGQDFPYHGGIFSVYVSDPDFNNVTFKLYISENESMAGDMLLWNYTVGENNTWISFIIGTTPNGGTYGWWNYTAWDAVYGSHKTLYYKINVSDGSLNNESVVFNFTTAWQNTAPAFSNVSPANDSISSLQPTLSVQVNDSDGNSTDVFIYTNETGSWVLRNSTTFTDGNGTIIYAFTAANSYNTTYYWKVAANDTHTNSTAIYHFTTTKQTPSVTLIYPYNGWTSIPSNPNLQFNVSSYDGNAWTEVYRSTDNSTWTLLSESNLANGTWQVSLGDTSLNTLFYWKVCTTNDNISWQNSSVWHFTTRGLNEAAHTQSVSISPYNATDIRLAWIIGQANDKTVIIRKTGSYPTSPSDGTEIYNGTLNNTWWDSTGLTQNTTYYYAFYGWNNTGGYADNAMLANATTYLLPEKPYSPAPSNGATGISASQNLSWSCTTPDVNGFNISSYDVYIGTSDPPSYFNNTASTTVDPGTLSTSTKYYWKVVAINDHGDRSVSDVWNFTTASSPVPSPPSNVNRSEYGYYWQNITWTKGSGATNTVVVVSTTDYPASISDGTVIYNGTDAYYVHSGLTKHTTYYYSLWSWNDAGYSTTYATYSNSIPDRQPTVTVNYPANNSKQPVNVSFSIYVFDADNDTLSSVIIESSVVGSSSWQLVDSFTNIASGTTLSFSHSFNAGTYYKWHIYIDDGYNPRYYPSTTYADGWYFTTNTPPSITSPSPADGATNVPINISQLTAYISDADGDTFDWQIWIITSVINGTNYGYQGNGTAETNGTKVCPITSNLDYGTTYTWYVNTTDGLDYSNTSYTFTTEYLNTPPTLSSRLPADGATDIHSPAPLSAYFSDAEGNNLNITFQQNNSGTYTDLYTYSNVACNATYSYNWTLSAGTYTWRISYNDGTNYVNSTDWTFTIAPGNSPPNAPNTPSPANASINVSLTPTLTWNCTDPNGDPITYDVYFGTTTSPSKVASNITSASYAPSTLNLSTTYYWKIVAYDNASLSNTSALWHFTTRGETAPTISNPSPANNSTGNAFNPALSIQVNDSENDNMTITFYNSDASGTTGTMIAYYSNEPNGTYTAYPTGMDSYNTTYYWKVVVNDTFVDSTAIYHFTTMGTGSGYNIEIRYEGNGNLVSLDANTTYTLLAYFGNVTDTMTITTNPDTVTYNNTPDLMRLYINNTYYRGVIPDTSSGVIVFYIPQNVSDLVLYTLSLDDKSGLYMSSGTWLQIYQYVNSTETVINEDYFSVGQTVSAYLVYNTKYYIKVFNPSGDVFSGTIDADSTTTKIITVLPLQNVKGHTLYDVVTVSAYMDNATNKLVFSYSSIADTYWAEISIYKYETNGTKTLIYQGNYSSNNFTIQQLTNISLTHEIIINISHSQLDNVVHTKLFVKPYKSGSWWTDTNSLLVIIFGVSPVSYMALIVLLIVVFILFTFGTKHPELGLIASGAFILFLNIAFGFSAASITVIATLMIVLGAVKVIQKEVNI
ncbi:MAG: hypothetical protein GWP10_17780 [Nitrospiraceae bacterium]|nr:hypothetical protein [Nitrospiraceae bacterium]